MPGLKLNHVSKRPQYNISSNAPTGDIPNPGRNWGIYENNFHSDHVEDELKKPWIKTSGNTEHTNYVNTT